MKDIPSLEVTRYVTAPSRMPALVEFTAEQIWVAIEARRQAASASAAAEPDLKVTEWQVLTQNPPPAPTKDFRVVRVPAPSGFGQFFEETVLLELLREVRALLAFTRIESKGDFADAAYMRARRAFTTGRSRTAHVTKPGGPANCTPNAPSLMMWLSSAART